MSSVDLGPPEGPRVRDVRKAFLKGGLKRSSHLADIPGLVSLSQSTLASHIDITLHYITLHIQRAQLSSSRLA